MTLYHIQVPSQSIEYKKDHFISGQRDLRLFGLNQCGQCGEHPSK
jgi:hypothetical protein